MTDALKTPVDVKMTTNIKQKGEQDQVSLEAKGEVYQKNNFTYVNFKEDLDDIGEVSTVLKVGRQEITVIRSGSVSMRQRYLSGELTEGSYETPYGTLKTEAQTDQVAVIWSDSGNTGRIQFGYDLTLQGSVAGRYDVTISIEEDT
ncbi:DUF1934 domain-containing protein [Salibacterium aidingense]|uniref:DUF1934 domain-containing protein n=1 Tax=Salibacterium aidingense TaxID=384933 RepID=UPI0004106367|nr:DUF1934 family protein [Salibacterium aidingense]